MICSGIHADTFCNLLDVGRVIIRFDFLTRAQRKSCFTTMPPKSEKPSENLNNTISPEKLDLLKNLALDTLHTPSSSFLKIPKDLPSDWLAFFSPVTDKSVRYEDRSGSTAKRRISPTVPNQTTRNFQVNYQPRAIERVSFKAT